MDLEGAMSAEETAYFESGGESGITESGDGGGDSGGADGAGATEGGDGGTDSGQPEAGKAAAKTANADHVPLATFLSEKTARKGLEKQLAEQAQKIANFEGKFSILERLKGAAADGVDPNAPKVPPTVEEDIFGNVKHTNETVAQLQKRLDDKEAAEKTALETTEKQTTFVNTYKADAAQFEAKNPDYRAAYNHLLQSRASELISIGYDNPKALQDAGASPQEVQAAFKALHDAVVADEYGIADLAMKKGKSPAEIIYGLAKQRGYAKAAAAGDGKSDAEKLLENIERGQNANKSLNGTGASSGDAEMTGERLIAMPQDEFEAWCTKNPAKARRLMGG